MDYTNIEMVIREVELISKKSGLKYKEFFTKQYEDRLSVVK